MIVGVNLLEGCLHWESRASHADVLVALVGLQQCFALCIFRGYASCCLLADKDCCAEASFTSQLASKQQQEGEWRHLMQSPRPQAGGVSVAVCSHEQGMLL